MFFISSFCCCFFPFEISIFLFLGGGGGEGGGGVPLQYVKGYIHSINYQ